MLGFVGGSVTVLLHVYSASSVNLEVHCCIVCTVSIMISVYNECVRVGLSQVSRAEE